jgi:hypothetical protein
MFEKPMIRIAATERLPPYSSDRINEQTTRSTRHNGKCRDNSVKAAINDRFDLLPDLGVLLFMMSVFAVMNECRRLNIQFGTGDRK